MEHPRPLFSYLCFFRGLQLVHTLRGEIIYLSLLMALVIYSTGMWWIFERNTDRVMNYMEHKAIDT